MSENVSALELDTNLEREGLPHSPSTEAELSIEALEHAMLGFDTKSCKSWETCEEEAINAMNEGDQGLFTRTLLQSPSIYSLKLGTLFAAKLNWCDSLESLLNAIRPLSIPTDGSDVYSDHPLLHKYVTESPDYGFASNSRSETDLEELALLRAAVDGSAQVVKVLIEFIGVNFGAMFETPFFRYVYWNKDVISRNECLKYILPKLHPSDEYLAIAARNGDLPTVEYLVNKMKLQENFLYVRAIRDAIENGHDDVAKWIISQPGLVPWKEYTGGIVMAAIDAQNYDMLVFVSGYIPKLLLCELGFDVADALWKFLKDKDRELYKKFVPQFPDGYTLFAK